MIEEIINYIIDLAMANGIAFGYPNNIPTDANQNKQNVIAVRTLGSTTSRSLCGKREFTQDFNILYRGTEVDFTSMTLLENVANLLDEISNEVLTNTNIIRINAERPSWAYEDTDNNKHYSLTMSIIYEKI